jgi:hypothetical protein
MEALVRNRSGAQIMLRIVWWLAVAFSTSTIARAQAQPATSAPPQSQPSAPQQDSVGEAARKAKAKKANAQPEKKVYTDEDLSRMRGTISVVGQAGSGSANSTGSGDYGGPGKKSGASNSEDKQEAFWRGRARPIRDKMAAIDQKMEQLRKEIDKSGGSGFDASSGLKQNVIYIHDRNGELKDLEQKKQELQNQLDQLAEEGRKAGALPAWFR